MNIAKLLEYYWPGCLWELVGNDQTDYKNLTWLDKSTTKPTESELLAKKAQVYKNQGFDGILFDWWHNYAGNCKHNVCERSPAEVEVVREAIAKKIRSQVGDNFIIMGNVNWNINDPAAKYMSGAFLELWKQAGCLTEPPEFNDISL